MNKIKTALAVASLSGALLVTGLSGTASASPSCTTATGQRVPATVAQYICTDSRVRQVGLQRSSWEWQNLIDCAVAAGSRGYFGRTAGTAWCLYNFVR